MYRFSTILVPLLLFGLVLGGCDSGGGVPDSLGENTGVGFTATSSTVGEATGSVTVEIEASDPGYKEFEVGVTVDQAQSTATLGEDVTGLPADSTITFSKSTTSGSTKSISFDVVDDDEFLEGQETLVLSLSTSDQSDVSLAEDTFTLRINENDKALTTQEAREEPAGTHVVVEGLVTRVEADGIFVQDGSGALFVFDSDLASQTSQGDSVRVEGSTSYFSGLFQIGGASDNELTEVLSSGHDLPAPEVVTIGEIQSNGEAYESELIRVEDFAIDAGGDQSFQGSTNYTISNNTGSTTLRVSGGSELVGVDIPPRANFQGVLSQFNGGFGGADEPDEGYQLLGLKTDDLEPINEVNLVSVNFSDDNLPPMNAISVASDADWETSSAGDPPNAPYAVANGFGSNEPSNDWLITPALDFSNHEGETLTFLNAKGFNDSGRRGLQVKVSTDYDGSGNPENFNWTDVSDQVNFSGGDFNFVESGEVDLSGTQFQSGEVYVAFQYRSTSSSNAATWEVDNIVVRGRPSN